MITISGFSLTDYEKAQKVVLIPEKSNNIETDVWLDISNLYFETGQSNPVIKFTANKDVYGFVFHINAKGQMLMLWPDPFDDPTLDNKIRKGEIKTIPELYTFVNSNSGREFVQFLAFEKQTNELNAYKQQFAQSALNGEYLSENPFLSMHVMSHLTKSALQRKGDDWNSDVEVFYYNERPTLYNVDFELSSAYSPSFYVDGKLITDRKETLKLTRGEHLLAYYENNKLKTKKINISGQTAINVPDGASNQSSTTPPPVESRKKVFVFAIGVGEFKDETVTRLPICPNDAKGFVQKLKQTYGTDVDFKSYILTNENATKNKIQSFLNSAIFSYIDKDTDVFIFFSGHGTQIPDDDGDEEDGLDEALVPYDYSNANPYNTLIKDDDLYLYYQKIGEHSKRTFVIIDSCFSGGTMKSSVLTKGFNIPLVTKTLGGSNRDGMESEIKNPSDNFLFLSAARGDQEAYANFGNLSYSLFTHIFVKVLNQTADQNSDGQISPDELLKAVDRTMSEIIKENRLKQQNPVLLNPANINFTIPVGK